MNILITRPLIDSEDLMAKLFFRTQDNSYSNFKDIPFKKRPCRSK